MSTWYMTVGVPGGEYAVKAEDDAAARDTFIVDYISYRAWTPDGPGTMPHVRPCPPEMVEWIEAEMHDYHETNAGIGRMKITGGWLYEVHDAQNLNPPEEYPNYNVVVHATERAPVAGAAGLTVLDVI
jgi:hypothetical protein